MDNDTKYSEQQLASLWNWRFKDAMVHKAPYTKRWLTYLDAYNGDYFKNDNLPDYKSNLVSNYIFSIIETIRPIMLDQNPKFQSVPRQPEGLEFCSDLQEVLSYEWDREDMSRKLYRELINTLILGTSIFFLPWDSADKNVKAIPVSAFNLFPDPLATNIDDSEYLIYASYVNVNILRRKFPSKSLQLHGGQINYSELVHDNNRNARVDNQVLVLEVWTKDYESYDEVKDNVKITKLKYPNGRVLTVCPELGIVLADKSNPYEDKEFPFDTIKDYDIPGKFWGEGEIAQLLSPQKHMNELNNAIIDNAKNTANMPWVIDKNAGIPQGKITARPGLIIRKNPGSVVDRLQAPSMPQYVINAVETYKHDMEQISGIFDTLKGNSETGVYTAQGILALQEAGQARIRLKVKLMENSLGSMCNKWFSRIKQFWKDDRWLGITRADGTYDLKKFTVNKLKFDYDIKITAGSTMPVNRGAMLDLMIRLAQTQMPDGQPLVDRQAVVEYLPEEVKSTLLRRMKGENQNLAQLQQQMEQLTQQLTQALQQNDAKDQQTMQVVEQLTGAVEKLNKQILQLQQQHDTLEAEKKKQEELDKIKTDSYNQGYGDAEKLAQPDMMGGQGMGNMMGENMMSGGTNETTSNNGDPGRLPEEILQGIEGLSDDELKLILEKNPELLDIINGANP